MSRSRRSRRWLSLHRMTALASGRALPALERHAGRPPAPVVGDRRRHDVSKAVREVERAHLGPSGAPARLRARHEQVTVTLADGSTQPIATHWNGKQLNSPNDIVCAADGSVYFSDPPDGRAEFFGVL